MITLSPSMSKHNLNGDASGKWAITLAIHQENKTPGHMQRHWERSIIYADKTYKAEITESILKILKSYMQLVLKHYWIIDGVDK